MSKVLPIFLTPQYFCVCSDLSLLYEAYEFSYLRSQTGLQGPRDSCIFDTGRFLSRRGENSCVRPQFFTDNVALHESSRYGEGSIALGISSLRGATISYSLNRRIRKASDNESRISTAR